MAGLTRPDIEALVPHAGSMCLLDSVASWDDDRIHCRSLSHQLGDAHPLWHNGGIAPVHLIEYAAQAAAVHGGLLASSTGEGLQTGFLAGVRDIALPERSIDTFVGTLDVWAFREMSGPQGMIYQFVVKTADNTLSSGRLTVMDAGPVVQTDAPEST